MSTHTRVHLKTCECGGHLTFFNPHNSPSAEQFCFCTTCIHAYLIQDMIHIKHDHQNLTIQNTKSIKESTANEGEYLQVTIK